MSLPSYCPAAYGLFSICERVVQAFTILSTDPHTPTQDLETLADQTLACHTCDTYDMRAMSHESYTLVTIKVHPPNQKLFQVSQPVVCVELNKSVIITVI